MEDPKEAHVMISMYKSHVLYRQMREKKRLLDYRLFCQATVDTLFFEAAKRDDAREYKTDLYQLLNLCKEADVHVEEARKVAEEAQAGYETHRKRVKEQLEEFGDKRDEVSRRAVKRIKERQRSFYFTKCLQHSHVNSILTTWGFSSRNISSGHVAHCCCTPHWRRNSASMASKKMGSP